MVGHSYKEREGVGRKKDLLIWVLHTYKEMDWSEKMFMTNKLTSLYHG